MGCGSSIGAASGSSVGKDPEDFHLDHIAFSKMGIADYDTYLIDEVTPQVNTIVDIVNELNSYIDDIKEAATIVCGGFKVEVVLEGATEHDYVLLQLTKAVAGPLPTTEEVTKLIANAKISAADAALSKAHKALYAELEKSHAALRVEADLLASDAAPSSLAAFNTALGGLRTAVGADYKVTLAVKPAGSGGSPSIRASVDKAVFAGEKYSMEAVGLLDIAKSKDAKSFYDAQASVATGLAGLTKAVKAAEADGITVSFELKKKKLVPQFEGGEGDAADDKKAAVKKAASAANSQLFKLFKSARNANANVNVAKALVALFESLKKKVETLGPDALKMLKVSPSANITPEGEFDFDPGVKLDLPDFSGKSTMETLTALLPGPAKLVLDAILKVKDEVIALIPKFQPLAEGITELVKKAPEVFDTETMQEKVKESVDGNMMAVPKKMAAAAGNLKTVTVEPIKIIKTMADTLVRLKDEFSAAITEVKAMFP